MNAISQKPPQNDDKIFTKRKLHNINDCDILAQNIVIAIPLKFKSTNLCCI